MDTFSIPHSERFDRTLMHRTAGSKVTPALFRQAVPHWNAFATWTPSHFSRRFPNVTVSPSVGLPDSSVPYSYATADYRSKMSTKAFIERVESGERCYLDEADLSLFDGLDNDFSFRDMVSLDNAHVRIWIGCNTRSGLHYDNMDNLLVQIYGKKDAILFAPSESRYLYPFGDNVTKSRVDPLAPDLESSPRFVNAKQLRLTLLPGQILFIPRGWWHFLSTPASSISLNCWFGASTTWQEQLYYIASAGNFTWLKVLRDFVWHGVLRRPFRQRLYCPPPTGKMLYDAALSGLSSALSRAARGDSDSKFADEGS